MDERNAKTKIKEEKEVRSLFASFKSLICLFIIIAMKKTAAFFIPLCGFILCCSSCQNFRAKSTALASSGTKADTQTVLSAFNTANYTNAVNFPFLSSMEPSATTLDTLLYLPSLSVRYISEGFQVNFVSDWKKEKQTYGFFTMPSQNKTGNAQGVYRYTESDDGSLSLGNLVKGDTDVYSYFLTPAYLANNAVSLASQFTYIDERTVRLAAQEEVLQLAKCLNVYGILTEYSSDITFKYVDLVYSWNSSSYQFVFWIDYQKRMAASGNYIIGGQATLSSIGTTSVSELSSFIGKM